MSIFKACDIRGVYGDEFDEAAARRIGRSLAAMVRRRGGGGVCVGGDFRRSTPSLKQALTTGLVEAGADVIDLGQLPTPAAYFAARHLGCAHAAIITASHNAGRYNGVKFMVGGRPAVPELIRELEGGLDAPPEANAGTVRTVNVLAAYEAAVLEEASRLVPGSAGGLKVAVDAMGGAFAEIAPRVLAAAGFTVAAQGCAIDPDFADRAPNPAVDANIQALCERVAAQGHELGIAFDGDGDRVAFIDHRGAVIPPEQIGVLLVEHVLQWPTVVYDQKCASVLARAVESAGGRAFMQPSGYGFIKGAMIDHGADLGVEVSGHYFFRALGGGDDGLFAALVVARLAAGLRTTLAEAIAPIGWPAITPDVRIPLAGEAAATLDAIAQTCGGDVSRLDGVRAAYGDGWALARASITEPLLTLRFEGRDARALRAIVDRFLAGVPALHAQVMERIR